jgi:hypothetical protein
MACVEPQMMMRVTDREFRFERLFAHPSDPRLVLFNRTIVGSHPDNTGPPSLP